MKIKFLFITLLFFLITVKAQSSKYDIFLLNDVIGNGIASQSENNDGSISYVLKTEVNAKLMFKERTALLDVELVFKDDVLIGGRLNRETNGEYQTVEFINEEGNTYYIENDEKEIIEKPINYTTTQFFFNEPIGVDEVYIERLNEFVPIEKEGNTYVTRVEGSVNYYIYENNKLVEYRMKNVIDIFMYKVSI